MTGQGISCIYTTVLPTGTSKVHSEAVKAAAYIIFHADVNNIENAVQKILHAGLPFQKFHYRFVAAMNGFILFIPTGIFNTTTIKHKTSAITTCIWRYSFFIREAANFYCQWCVFVGLYWYKTFDDFFIYTNT